MGWGRSGAQNIESVKKENLTKGLEKLGREGKVVIAARLNEMLGGKKAQKTETASSPHSRGTPDTKKGKKRQAKKTAGNDDWRRRPFGAEVLPLNPSSLSSNCCLDETILSAIV
eukprot:2402603-Rhodomonas_salina.1